jgi:hypothetical protein
MCTILILSVDLYGYETRPFALTEEHKFWNLRTGYPREYLDVREGEKQETGNIA